MPVYVRQAEISSCVTEGQLLVIQSQMKHCRVEVVNVSGVTMTPMSLSVAYMQAFPTSLTPRSA